MEAVIYFSLTAFFEFEQSHVDILTSRSILKRPVHFRVKNLVEQQQQNKI